MKNISVCGEWNPKDIQHLERDDKLLEILYIAAWNVLDITH